MRKLISYKIEGRNGYSPSVSQFYLAKGHQIIALNETVGALSSEYLAATHQKFK